MTAVALKFERPTPPAIEPPAGLGDVGAALWRQTIADFETWFAHDLGHLEIVCKAKQQMADIDVELSAKRIDFKRKRQLRSDWHTAATTFRHHLRELSLSAAPADARPKRVPGRYSGA